MPAKEPVVLEWCALDARVDAYSGETLGLAYCYEGRSGWLKDWDAMMILLQEQAELGRTFVAHNAELHCSTLFLHHREFFRAHYHNERWVNGEWFYHPRKQPAQVWDSFSLSGRLSISELGNSLHMPLWPVPGRLWRKYREKNRPPCFEHNVPACPICGHDPNVYEWVCDKHGRGECLECWQTRASEIVFAYMQSYSTFLQPYGLSPRRTIGSTSMQLWKRLDSPTPCELRSKEQAEMARAAYHGGRVEAFKLGHLGPVYYHDIQSMYAWVMTWAPMPVPGSVQLVESERLDDRFLVYEGCTEATVTIPESYLPVLPVRRGEILAFPVGRVRDVFTNCELVAAIERGARLEHVHRCLYALETCHPFEVFTHALLELRDALKRAHDPREQTVKLVLNSLYGRLGLRTDQLLEVISPLPPGTGTRDWPRHEWREVDGHTLIKRSRRCRIRDRYSNPLWAAQIAGHARLRLLHHMEQAGTNLVYVDTDSVISTEPLPTTGPAPGAIRLEGMYPEAWIVGPKLYHLSGNEGHDRVAAAGVPKRVALQFLNQIETTWSQPVGVRDAFDSGLVPGAWAVHCQGRYTTIGKRHTLYPNLIYELDSWSDTAALTFGESGE